ncbi:MAG: radical SAM protein [Syntrophaceae bacterium]|nr:radical SAM protein [Syntrophaceae bacterium]
MVSSGEIRHIYGPVISRRLGRSLGIDVIPHKICTYDCVYCQIGKTTDKVLDRREYVSAQVILSELSEKLVKTEKVDFITLAGSGEPTLNSAIGAVICGIKEMTDIPVAVLTNGSLLWVPEVQDALMNADIVLPSLDAGDEALFQYVNRPHQDLVFDQVVEGLVDFTKCFPGEVWLEVLLLAGVTGVKAEAKKIAKLVERIGPAITHLNTVCRPPSEGFACPLSLELLSALQEIFPGKVDIIMEQGNQEIMKSDVPESREGDIIALLSRRPCTSSEVASGLGIHPAEVLKYMESLVETGKLRRMLSGGRYFYAIARSQNAGGQS